MSMIITVRKWQFQKVLCFQVLLLHILQIVAIAVLLLAVSVLTLYHLFALYDDDDEKYDDIMMMIGNGQNLGWSTFPTIDALPSLELIQMWGWCWWWFWPYDDQHDIIDDDDKDDDDNVCVVHERLRADAFCAETITNFPTNRVSPASSDNNCIPLCIAQLFWYLVFGILL